MRVKPDRKPYGLSLKQRSAMIQIGFLSLDETAEVLRCDPSTVGKKCKAGELVAARVGSRVLVSRASLEAYLSACLQAVDTDAPLSTLRGEARVKDLAQRALDALLKVA